MFNQPTEQNVGQWWQRRVFAFILNGLAHKLVGDIWGGKYFRM